MSGGRPTLRPATLSDLDIVASWIGSARECELWAGWRVRFPIDRTALPETIGFSEANTFRWPTIRRSWPLGSW